MKPILLVVLLITGCTVNWRNVESDYDIEAHIIDDEYGCEVWIKRTEIRGEKGIEATK